MDILLIKTFKGENIIIDECSYEQVSKYSWHLTDEGYAFSSPTDKLSGKRLHILMHRLINETPDAMETDHINGNRLDNRKENLRSVTKAQNMMNKKNYKSNKSGYKGVYFKKDVKAWVSSIQVNKKRKFLGAFNTSEEAYNAYKEQERILFGEYARNVTYVDE